MPLPLPAVKRKITVACGARGSMDPGLRRGDEKGPFSGASHELSRGDADKGLLLRALRASACPSLPSSSTGCAVREWVFRRYTPHREIIFDSGDLIGYSHRLNHENQDYAMTNALEGILIVTLEQTVATPVATARLTNAGTRVIKLKRPENDFTQNYDDFILNQSNYFV